MYLYGGFDEQEVVRPERKQREEWPRPPRMPPPRRPDGRYTSHPNERVHRLTPVDLYGELVPGLQRTFIRTMGRPPACRALALLAAQIAVETGARLTKLHNFNISNAKSAPRYPHVYFTCTECPSEEMFRKLKKDPREGHLVERVQPNDGCKEGQIKALFRAPHPTCRFRAFDSLDQGLDYHLALLRGPRYVAGWPALEAGDARGFVTALKQGGYFQGELEGYVRATAAKQREIAARLRCAPAA
jgi:hypothetical protein